MKVKVLCPALCLKITLGNGKKKIKDGHNKI